MDPYSPPGKVPGRAAADTAQRPQGGDEIRLPHSTPPAAAPSWNDRFLEKTDPETRGAIVEIRDELARRQPRQEWLYQGCGDDVSILALAKPGSTLRYVDVNFGWYEHFNRRITFPLGRIGVPLSGQLADWSADVRTQSIALGDGTIFQFHQGDIRDKACPVGAPNILFTGGANPNPSGDAILALPVGGVVVERLFRTKDPKSRFISDESGLPECFELKRTFSLPSWDVGFVRYGGAEPFTVHLIEKTRDPTATERAIVIVRKSIRAVTDTIEDYLKNGERDALFDTSPAAIRARLFSFLDRYLEQKPYEISGPHSFRSACDHFERNLTGVRLQASGYGFLFGIADQLGAAGAERLGLMADILNEWQRSRITGTA